MSLPYPVDPSLPSNPSPLFSDSEAVRGDHLRANNGEIWANFDAIVSTILGGASLSIDGTMAANSDLLFASQKALVTYINARLDALVPIGTSFEYSGMQSNIPASFMIESGANLLRADYAPCFAKLSAVTGTFTVTSANPGLATQNGHPYQTGDCVHATTTGALPTNLPANTNRYVIVNDANTFWFASTFANALAGTKIDTTAGTQSGTHTLTWIPWGAADGTHFYLPDTQGLSTEGSGIGSSAPLYNPWLSSNYKGRLGQYKQDVMQSITGSVSFISETNELIAFSGSGCLSVSSGGSRATVVEGGAAFPSTVLTFNSANSSGARTDVKTAGPRVGKWKIIKVM